MAVVPVCYKIPYKDHVLGPQNSVRRLERVIMCRCYAFPQACISSDACKRCQILYPNVDSLMKTRTRGEVNTSKGAIFNQDTLHFQNPIEGLALHRVWNVKGEDFYVASHTSKASINEKQLGLLDSYFGKLQGNANKPSSDSSDETIELLDESRQINTKEELESLNSYLGKLNKENPAAKSFSVHEDSRRGYEEKPKNFMKLRKKDVNSGSGRSQTLQQNDETSDLYLISILASINIAVFLFEIASPVRNSEFELFSLPLLYGAKINDLILVGEWWRLVTPMFLHSGVFHVALGCWSLLTFGPQVCRGYGSFTFFLIYMLGGISGNLTSFLHTPEPTVGGTGPIFAIIGAWLVYQVQNKGVIAKDVSESLFHKAIITTGLSFILSHFGPIDDWTHLGAALTGIIYGFFTCPTLQLDNASSRTGQDEGVAFVRGYANPCKSLILFAVFILFLGSLLFFVEPPLDTLVADDLVWF
ncbi:RHOMBOID-like protein 9, chloroplastic isoform X2 [Hevea brasiliensis]|uniref:RHOMBOID-like protein 9, chloroplastic isoform X2 n=1 Tax=Hevea brasiliensis TaxID=3981 RepID=UPI0025D40663|nr:RHOMBOID-like protein 9, chloroplastic isoform X2 [Hevea brasiliensis]